MHCSEWRHHVVVAINALGPSSAVALLRRMDGRRRRAWVAGHSKRTRYQYIGPEQWVAFVYGSLTFSVGEDLPNCAGKRRSSWLARPPSPRPSPPGEGESFSRRNEDRWLRWVEAFPII